MESRLGKFAISCCGPVRLSGDWLSEVVTMCAMRRALLLVTTVFWLLSFPAFGQNSPSLGDAARSTRQQEQEKDQPGKGPSAVPKAARVVTDDDTPPRAGAPDQPSK